MNETDGGGELGLVRRAVAGDSRAFEILAANHRGEVVKLCRSAVGDADAAEDLAQETFVRAWMHIGSLGHPFAFGPWVRRIALNLLATWKRGQRRGARHLDRGADLAGLADVAQQHRRELAELVEEVGTAMASLPAGERDLLGLHFRDGVSRTELASRLGVHPSTVGRRLDVALESLRRELTRANRRVPLAPRVLTALIASLASTVPHSANAAHVAFVPPPPTGLLPVILKGVGIMGSSSKTVMVGCAAAVIAAGIYFGIREPAGDQPLPIAVAAQMQEARSSATMNHPLGSESVFTLAAGEKVVLLPGSNPHGFKQFEVSRTIGDVSVLVTRDDGTNRVYQGPMAGADFVMLGATNYIEDGSVEGTADTLPPSVMTYLTWKQEGERFRYHLQTRVSEAFGVEFESFKQDAISGRLRETEAVARAEHMMKAHGMYPKGEHFRSAGAGFVP